MNVSSTTSFSFPFDETPLLRFLLLLAVEVRGEEKRDEVRVEQMEAGLAAGAKSSLSGSGGGRDKSSKKVVFSLRCRATAIVSSM